MTRKRKMIGRWNDLATRSFVYQTDEGLEVDEIDHFEIVRKRVFFDDIQLVTKHKQFGAGFLITMGIITLIFFGSALALANSGEMAAAGWVALVGSPFLIMILIRLMLQQEVINVYGRRSKATVRYTFRKTYAEALFEEICAHARAAQARIAAEQRAAEKKTGEMELPPEVLLPPTTSDLPPEQ